MFFNSMQQVLGSVKHQTLGKSPPSFEPCILIVGFGTTPAALAAVKRWDEKGYHPGQLWTGFAHASVRFIERNFSIPVCAPVCEVGELVHEMEQLTPSMLAGINFAELIQERTGCGLKEVIVELSATPWKLILRLDHFPF